MKRPDVNLKTIQIVHDLSIRYGLSIDCVIRKLSWFATQYGAAEKANQRQDRLVDSMPTIQGIELGTLRHPTQSYKYAWHSMPCPLWRRANLPGSEIVAILTRSTCLVIFRLHEFVYAYEGV